MSKAYRSALISLWVAIIGIVWYVERNTADHVWLVVGGCQCLGAIAYLVLAHGSIQIRIRDALIISLVLSGVCLVVSLGGLVTAVVGTPPQCGAFGCAVNPPVDGVPILTMGFALIAMLGMLISSAMLGAMMLVAKYAPSIGRPIRSFRRA